MAILAFWKSWFGPTGATPPNPSDADTERTSMSETNSTTATDAGADPLKKVADAMQAALDSAREGAADARQTAEAALPAATQFAARFLYTTCYTISYGVVFPTTLLAMSVPRNNALVRGLIDGSHAAQQKADEILGRPADLESIAESAPVAVHPA